MFNIEYIEKDSGVWLSEDNKRAEVRVKFIEFEDVHPHHAILT